MRKVKEEKEKVGLKLNIQKTKIMTSGPIISRQTDGLTMETVRDFIFLGSKITAGSDYSHEKMHVPWKKSYDQPRECIKKQRHYLADIHLVKAMVFPVVMYGCESWPIKKVGPKKELIVLNCGVGDS